MVPFLTGIICPATFLGDRSSRGRGVAAQTDSRKSHTSAASRGSDSCSNRGSYRRAPPLPEDPAVISECVTTPGPQAVAGRSPLPHWGAPPCGDRIVLRTGVVTNERGLRRRSGRHIRVCNSRGSESVAAWRPLPRWGGTGFNVGGGATRRPNRAQNWCSYRRGANDRQGVLVAAFHHCAMVDQVCAKWTLSQWPSKKATITPPLCRGARRLCPFMLRPVRGESRCPSRA